MFAITKTFSGIITGINFIFLPSPEYSSSITFIHKTIASFAFSTFYFPSNTSIENTSQRRDYSSGSSDESNHSSTDHVVPPI